MRASELPRFWKRPQLEERQPLETLGLRGYRLERLLPSVLLPSLLLLVGCDTPAVEDELTPSLAPETPTLPPAFETVTPSSGTPTVTPFPELPPDEAQVTLGRWLFYDLALSLNGDRACGVCHEQKKGFTDGLVRTVGTTGQMHAYNTPALTNVYARVLLGRANPAEQVLETQMLTPLFGTHPVEMGMAGQEEVILTHLRTEAVYQHYFPRAFPELVDPFQLDPMTEAIAAFERTLISSNSGWDRYQRGETDALSAQAVWGAELFQSERFGCARCHTGVDLNFPPGYDPKTGADDSLYVNIGLYNVDGMGSYPEGGQGLYEFTLLPEDRGRFRIPVLRNLTVTKPYMHDGSVPDLSSVLSLYAAGGRILYGGAYPGDGRESPLKDPRISGFEATAEELQAVVAFLESLTDDEFITDTRFKNPW